MELEAGHCQRRGCHLPQRNLGPGSGRGALLGSGSARGPGLGLSEMMDRLDPSWVGFHSDFGPPSPLPGAVDSLKARAASASAASGDQRLRWTEVELRLHLSGLRTGPD